MCRHIYDWNIVDCDVKQPIHLTYIGAQNNFIFKGRDLTRLYDKGVSVSSVIVWRQKISENKTRAKITRYTAFHLLIKIRLFQMCENILFTDAPNVRCARCRCPG